EQQPGGAKRGEGEIGGVAGLARGLRVAVGADPGAALGGGGAGRAGAFGHAGAPPRRVTVADDRGWGPRTTDGTVLRIGGAWCAPAPKAPSDDPSEPLHRSP